MVAGMLSLPDLATAYEGPFDQACEGFSATDPEAPVACQTGNENPISGSDGILLRVVRLLSFVVGVASVIMVILGGLKYITSNGDSSAVSSAKNTILYALIGVVVFLLSQIIVRFVLSNL